ncbi:MAG: hypothetical protein MI785_20810 [Kiloniellales bacterium]|nr:hypothetical protein [Kiloniellales bacterium]
MLDKIVAGASVLALIAFLGVVISFVAEPDLWFVIIVVVYIAVYFIWREIRQGGSHFEGEN